MSNIWKNKKLLIGMCAVLIFVCLAGCQSYDASPAPENSGTNAEVFEGEPDQSYSSKDEVAEYIHEFGVLPPNYITKSEAADAGWDKSAGNLWDVTNMKSIGGDYFGNREGLLPDANGRKYYECDINYNGGYRGAERIVFSNDGLIFYTSDHYESFEQLY
jgi:hypothetical protein